MPLTGKEMLKLAKQHGWQVKRINGSHHIMVKKGYSPVSIPVHNKDLKVGTEKKILKDLGIK